MGYHLFPGAITALRAARLFGRAACYQMTGGPIEIIGGGFHAENPLMSSLVRPSRMIERAALAVARQFDLIVVRGDKARQFLRQNGVTRRIVAITAGIATQPSPSPDGRVYDLVFVGRLSEIKQPLQFLEIVAAVQARVPAVRAAMVGDGPLGDAARRFAAERGIADRVDFLGQRDGVNEVLARSKIFVLTSRSEGLSIALLEALACGVPPVAARVGELSELIVDGQTGWLVTPDAIGEYVEHIITLLEDEGMRRRMSVQSWQGAMAAASVPRVAQRWNQVLAELGSVKRESEDVSPACPAPVCISEVSHV